MGTCLSSYPWLGEESGHTLGDRTKATRPHTRTLAPAMHQTHLGGTGMRPRPARSTGLCGLAMPPRKGPTPGKGRSGLASSEQRLSLPGGAWRGGLQPGVGCEASAGTSGEPRVGQGRWERLLGGAPPRCRPQQQTGTRASWPGRPRSPGDLLPPQSLVLPTCVPLHGGPRRQVPGPSTST